MRFGSGSAPIAKAALERIAALYAIEARIRGHRPEERCAARQTETKPLVLELKAWLEARLAEVSGKSAIAEAIRYGLKLWDGLAQFLEDGRLEIDSNTVERLIRPIALTRKNALFAGNDQGGAHWGVVALLVETAKLNGVDPHAYLSDVLTKLAGGWPMSRLDELMPWAYANTAAA